MSTLFKPRARFFRMNPISSFLPRREKRTDTSFRPGGKRELTPVSVTGFRPDTGFRPGFCRHRFPSRHRFSSPVYVLTKQAGPSIAATTSLTTETQRRARIIMAGADTLERVAGELEDLLADLGLRDILRDHLHPH